MHELNIKDVFCAKRLRHMSTTGPEQAHSPRGRTEKTSIKAGMDALMKELLGQTGLSEPYEDSPDFDPENIIH